METALTKMFGKTHENGEKDPTEFAGVGWVLFAQLMEIACVQPARRA